MHIRDMFELGDQVPLVTGGSRGRALKLAEVLGEMGSRVAFLASAASRDVTGQYLAVDGGACIV
ncbi:hypothetical protein [Paraburkholderia dinghuensis]|uniref:SDR family oxidoreductase n=1 Tax=Paraburkholderia dinghuensis TaxID=2305225 RepID=A0A3N6MUH5_9BURK|nr:hypothetical protein [Paraburkholderia dinghuensis]RQH07508.1 hypothetical protein D1Y85_09015 [Paraburkholderia dinghuensis]